LLEAPGTYLYGAIVGHHDFDKDDERETASGRSSLIRAVARCQIGSS